MPDISAVTKTYVACPGERLAAGLAGALLRARVVSSDGFRGDAQEFVRSAISEFVERHGGTTIRKIFRLHLLLTTTLDDYSTRSDEVDPARFYLTLEPSEAGYFGAGPTLAILERAHPRLPSTFLQLLTGALSPWIRVYDHNDACGRIEMLREWYSADPQCESIELPDVESSIPASLRERPLRPAELRRLLPSFPDDVRGWMQRAVDIDAASRRAPRQRTTGDMEVEIGDHNPPLPSLLTVFRPGDNIEACFDDESRGMMEVSPEPNLIIPFDATNPESVRRAFRRTLRAVCVTLAKAAELLLNLPGATGKEQGDGV